MCKSIKAKKLAEDEESNDGEDSQDEGEEEVQDEDDEDGDKIEEKDQKKGLVSDKIIELDLNVNGIDPGNELFIIRDVIAKQKDDGDLGAAPVSYTHLTLPTIYSV